MIGFFVLIGDNELTGSVDKAIFAIQACGNRHIGIRANGVIKLGSDNKSPFSVYATPFAIEFYRGDIVIGKIHGVIINWLDDKVSGFINKSVLVIQSCGA